MGRATRGPNPWGGPVSPISGLPARNGLLGGELLLGEEALLLELGELGELGDGVDRWSDRLRQGFVLRGSLIGAGGLGALVYPWPRLAAIAWSRSANFSAWCRATRPLTADAVPATTAVRAIPRMNPGMSSPLLLSWPA